MKIFTLFLALLALALPAGLLFTSHKDGIMTDRRDEAVSAVAQAGVPGAANYAR